jgi:hypothetical protein
MENALEQLRENSSTRRSIHLPLEDVSLSDHELSQALQVNKHVRDLSISTMCTRRNWDSLLRVIATRQNLKVVAVADHDDDEDPQVQTTRSIKFFQAIQVNSAIREVILYKVRVSGASIASFLDAATFLTKFDLLNVRMEAHEQVQGAQELAAALQRNTNIRWLSLKNVKDVYLLPILSGLAANTHIKKLGMGCIGQEDQDISLAASTGLKSLLESTATIGELRLLGFRFKAETFGPLAQGLINSENITDVKLRHCTFDDAESALFKSVVRSKPNALSIRNCTVQGRTLPATLFTNILRPDSLLRSLELCCSILTDDGYTTLLSLVEKSKVELLRVHYIGKISEQHKFLALIASIPKMRIKALQVGMMSRVDARDWSSALVRAVKMNSSLRSVVVDEGGGFNEDQRRKLNSYFARNEGLSKWIAAPATRIPKSALPKAIEAARAVGPGVVVHILRTLGSSVGPVEGKRSRKRPRFYTPTW